jgi:hypothetical protein
MSLRTEHTWVFMSSARYFCPVLTKFGFSRQIFVVTNTKFHGIRPAGLQWSCTQTGMMKLRDAFRNYANGPKTRLLTGMYLRRSKYWILWAWVYILAIVIPNVNAFFLRRSHLWPVWLYQNFPHYPIKRKIFRKKNYGKWNPSSTTKVAPRGQTDGRACMKTLRVVFLQLCECARNPNYTAGGLRNPES